MRMHPVPVKRAPLFLHFTYSVCLHAAALSLLFSLPVFAGGGATPGGEYVVSLTGQGEQTETADGQTPGEMGEDNPAGMNPDEKNDGIDGSDDDGGENVPDDPGPSDKTFAAAIKAAVKPSADKPNPMPVPSNIVTPLEKGPELASAVKPVPAEALSKTITANSAGSVIKVDAVYQAKAEPAVITKASATVKPPPSAAAPVQGNPPEKSDVPEAVPEPEPESVTATPSMFIPAKTAVSEPDHFTPPKETNPQETIPTVADKKMPPSKTTRKGREKGDAGPSPDSAGMSSEPRGKAPVGRSHQAGKPAVAASAQKVGQLGGGNSGTSGMTSGSGASSKKGGTGGSVKSSGRAGTGGEGGVGGGDVSGTPSGSGQGYKFSSASTSREFGLLGGIGGQFGGSTLARKERPSGKDVSAEKEKQGTEEVPIVAIRVPETLLVQDIKIEVLAESTGPSDLSLGLVMRAHPANRKKRTADQEKPVEGTEVTIGKGDPGPSATKTLLLRKAEKGVYILSLTNTGNASSVTVIFRFYERSERERIKEYKAFSLQASSVKKFKFLMPEAVFWDDTDRFSGNLEDSHSVTKFDYKSGLLWSEEKER